MRIKHFFLLFFAALLLIRPFRDGLTYPAAQNLFQFAVLAAAVLYLILLLIGKVAYQTTRLELPAASFLLVSFASAIGSASPYRSEVLLLQYFYYFSLFFLLFQIINFPLKKKTGIDGRRLILTVILITATLVSLYGIQQYFWGLKETLNYMTEQNILDKMPPEMMVRLTSGRAFSTFVYPNIFAAFLITMIPVSLGLAFSPAATSSPAVQESKVKERLKLPGLLLAVLFVFTLFLTKSIGGLMIIFLVCLLWLANTWAKRISLPGIKNRWRRLARKSFPYLFLFGGFLAIFLVLNSLKLIPHILSLQDRFFYWISSLEIFKQRPFLGYGPGSFGIQYAHFKLPAAMETQHSHSIFFEILAEDGILGIAAFLWFWVLMFQKSWKGATTGLEKGVFWGILALFLHSQIDFDLADPSLATYLFFLPALIPLKTDAIPSGQKSEHRRQSLTQISAGLIILLLLAAGIQLVKIHRSEKIYQNGFDLISTGNGSQGLTLLYKAIEVNPANPDNYAKLGAFFFQAGEVSKDPAYFQKSAEAYHGACTAEPYSASFRFRLGLAAENVAKITGDQRWTLLAEQSFKDAVLLYPTKEEYRNKIK